ncbi:MAG: DUF2147 domain-containing protein [Chlamydiales bacterium]|nr:DUF2147 domain-containing protein [Chlamydiales bacterium]
MNQMYRLTFLFVLSVYSLFGATIEGFWKIVNETTQAPRCIVAVYEHENICYGRIIATYNEEGAMKESIYEPKEKAPGVVGNPYYCGLDFIWGLQNSGSSYKGKILDPEKGNIYNAELWTVGGNLIVRGKLLFFGRNQTWFPAEEADFPAGFKKPSLHSLIPNIPTVN